MGPFDVFVSNEENKVMINNIWLISYSAIWQPWTDATKIFNFNYNVIPLPPHIQCCLPFSVRSSMHFGT
jgi:hypothetical protein